MIIFRSLLQNASATLQSTSFDRKLLQELCDLLKRLEPNTIKRNLVQAFSHSSADLIWEPARRRLD